MKRFVTIAAFAFAVALPIAGTATTHGSTEAQPAQQAALAEGEIRRIDKEQKKLTIRHGPIASLDMPPMTMVFQVKDPALLDNVKVGDKVRFTADKIGGAYTVMQLEQAK